MSTRPQRSDHGRTAKAADLIATLADQLPLGHPARATVRELQQLFTGNHDRVRDLLERVPGASLQAKAERIGISKGSLWAIWRGRYAPNPTVMARIEAAVAAGAEE